MKQVLDNPAWHALVSGCRHLGQATDQAGYFEPAVSPFVALETPSQAALENLYELVPFNDNVILVTSEKLDIADPWKEIMRIGGYQMIYRGSEKPVFAGPEPIKLTNDHVPEMLDLTKLTNPGPFLARTIEFGHYEGIFDNGKLVAMAGQRMYPRGFAEISAVCTHPEHLGKGYARRLLLRQVNRIQDAGETPFLHVKLDNQRAIKVYESLGFEIRTDMFFCVLTKMS